MWLQVKNNQLHNPVVNWSVPIWPNDIISVSLARNAKEIELESVFYPLCEESISFSDAKLPCCHGNQWLLYAYANMLLFCIHSLSSFTHSSIYFLLVFFKVYLVTLSRETWCAITRTRCRCGCCYVFLCKKKMMKYIHL